jgi:hypothetical protein
VCSRLKETLIKSSFPPPRWGRVRERVNKKCPIYPPHPNPLPPGERDLFRVSLIYFYFALFTRYEVDDGDY